MTLYKCTECGELKPESEFRLRSKYKNAIDSRCRECTNMAKRNKEQRKDALKTYISYNECNRTKGAKPFDEFIEYCGYVYTKFRACKDSWRDIDGDCK